VLSEQKSRSLCHGTLRPALEPLHALRYHIPRFYERMVRLTQVLGAGGILANPTEADLKSEIGARYPPLLPRRRSRRRSQNPSVETRLGRAPARNSAAAIAIRALLRRRSGPDGRVDLQDVGITRRCWRWSTARCLCHPSVTRSHEKVWHEDAAENAAMCAATLALIGIGGAAAQTFPSRPITIIAAVPAWRTVGRAGADSRRSLGGGARPADRHREYRRRRRHRRRQPCRARRAGRLHLADRPVEHPGRQPGDL